MIVTSKFGNSFNSGGSNGKSSEDFTNIGSLLHGDNSELIFFIDPYEEGLVLVVIDTSSGWPVSVETTGFQESVSFLEKEMICDKLFLILFGHGGERVVGTSMLTGELLQSSGYDVFNFISLSFGNTWTKWECSQVSSDSDSC